MAAPQSPTPPCPFQAHKKTSQARADGPWSPAPRTAHTSMLPGMVEGRTRRPQVQSPGTLTGVMGRAHPVADPRDRQVRLHPEPRRPCRGKAGVARSPETPTHLATPSRRRGLGKARAAHRATPAGPLPGALACPVPSHCRCSAGDDSGQHDVGGCRRDFGAESQPRPLPPVELHVTAGAGQPSRPARRKPG